MDGDSQTTLVSTKAAPSASALFTDSVTAATTNPKAQTQAIHKPEIDIFAASQRGDVDAIRTLIDSGSASATDRDPQNITPLHWAAINAQLPTCQYLLEQGAEVDARGGDLVATPLQWAARNGHFYIIQLLIAHGADPKITDTQGFNTLHIVTHSSRVMSLLCILHQPISVDSRDPEGHTSLMWAVYQGNASSVDVLLEHGANVNIKDDVGLTALHWAVVRGDRNCIRRLLEHGAEINAKDNEGRTARDMAVEFKILGTWERALEEGDLTEDGLKRKKPLSDARLGGRRHRCWTCLSGCRHRLWTSLVESRSGKHRGGFHAIESAWNQTKRFCSTYLGANIGIQLKSVFVAQTLTPNHRQKSRD